MAKPSKAARKPNERASSPNVGLRQIQLEQLHFDANNPRFANEGTPGSDSQILDLIVTRFGVDDVLSSIAVNGYMATEPLVGIELPGNGGVRVIEGNRRLAALLILADDPRAASHANLQKSLP